MLIMAAEDSTQTPVRKLSGEEDFNGLSHSTPSLPASWYFDPDQHQKELNSIFYRHWIYLCHVSTLKEPRSFRRFTIGDQGIFLVRDEQGVLRGFHNTCRHRGSEICLAQEGQFANRLMRCPYHQWAYGLDGRLVATSSHAEAMDFNKSDYPLFQVAVKEWRGSVYVCLADEPPDLEQSFGRSGDRTENWPMEALVVGHTWQKTMECNWKVFWENFNECLHCPNIHPELCDLVPIYGRRVSHFRDDPNWALHQNDNNPKFSGGLRSGAKSWSMSGRPSGQDFPTLSDEEIQQGQAYFVSLPSVYIAAHADYMRTVRILPLGPERTEITVEWLFPPESLMQENFDLNDIVDFAILVMQQDAGASEMNQRGVHSRKFNQGVLMPEEHHVKNFQDWVRQQMKQASTSL